MVRVTDYIIHELFLKDPVLLYLLSEVSETSR